jgi:hypothetical protein
MVWLKRDQSPMQKSKFDSFLAEMDSTLWPIPGQEMNNRSVVYKSLPSIQAILQQPPDTDSMGIIGAAPSFAAPLTHVIEKSADAFQSLQTLKSMFVEAKASPVYQGRERQQALLDELIQKIEKMEKFLYARIVEELDGLSLASLGNDAKIEG